MTPNVVRHELIQDYLLEFSIYHQQSNHYQITLPQFPMLVSPLARSVFLRVVVHDCSVAKLFTFCIIRQVGLDNGVNLSNYIIPTSTSPAVFELVLPWSGSGIPQMSIEWDKSMHSHNLSTATMTHTLSGTSLHSTQAIAAQPTGNQMVGHGQAMVPPLMQEGDVTHGVIYLGISGYQE